MDRTARRVLPLIAASITAAGIGFAQTSPPRLPPRPPVRPPAPQGHLIETVDGDTVIVDGDDRVAVVRRRHADVRVVADAPARTLLVMADWGSFDRPAPDGGVDRVWRFEGIAGAWPLDARWQGTITLLEPEGLRGEPGGRGDVLVLDTPAGRVAFRAGSNPTPAGDAHVLTFSRMNGGGRQGASFDEAEREAGSPNAQWSISTMDFGRPGPGTPPVNGGAVVAFGNEVVTSGVAGFAEVGVTPGVPTAVPPAIRPRPVRRVEPVWPDPATMPGVQGVVTVLIVVGSDGSVSDAIIRRGIPGLDAAALAAARQWRFAPTGGDTQTFLVSWPYPPRR